MERCELCIINAICKGSRNCNLSEFAKRRIDEHIEKITAIDNLGDNNALFVKFFNRLDESRKKSLLREITPKPKQLELFKN